MGVFVVVDYEAVFVIPVDIKRICSYTWGVTEELGVDKVFAVECFVSYCSYSSWNYDGFQLAISPKSIVWYTLYTVRNY